eukprot:m.344004 g.344004  ORF g.344004 m.344004 type:complete len:600 (-) comp20641_c0_seq1:139-1938(-)
MRATSSSLHDYFASCSPLHQSILSENDRIHQEHIERWSALSEEAQDDLVNGSYSIPCGIDSYNEEDWGASVRAIIEHGRKIRASMQSATKELKTSNTTPFSTPSPRSDASGPTIKIFGDGSSEGETKSSFKQRRQTMSKLKRPSISNPLPLRDHGDTAPLGTVLSQRSNLIRSQSDSADEILGTSCTSEEGRAASLSPRITSRFRQRSRTADGLERHEHGTSAVDILTGMSKEVPPAARYSVIMGSSSTDDTLKSSDKVPQFPGRRLRGKKTQRSRSTVGTQRDTSSVTTEKLSPTTRRGTFAKMTPRMFRSTKRNKNATSEESTETTIEIVPRRSDEPGAGGDAVVRTTTVTFASLPANVSETSTDEKGSDAEMYPSNSKQAITLPHPSSSTTDSIGTAGSHLGSVDENDSQPKTASCLPSEIEPCNSNPVKCLNVSATGLGRGSSSTDGASIGCTSTVLGVTSDGSSCDGGSCVALSPTNEESTTDANLSLDSSDINFTPRDTSTGDTTAAIKASARRPITIEELDQIFDESLSPLSDSTDGVASPMCEKPFDTSNCSQRTTVLLDELDRSLKTLSPSARLSMFGDRSDEDDDAYDA